MIKKEEEVQVVQTFSLPVNSSPPFLPCLIGDKVCIGLHILYYCLLFSSFFLFLVSFLILPFVETILVCSLPGCRSRFSRFSTGCGSRISKCHQEPTRKRQFFPQKLVLVVPTCVAVIKLFLALCHQLFFLLCWGLLICTRITSYFQSNLFRPQHVINYSHNLRYGSAKSYQLKASAVTADQESRHRLEEGCT